MKSRLENQSICHVSLMKMIHCCCLSWFLLLLCSKRRAWCRLLRHQIRNVSWDATFTAYSVFEPLLLTAILEAGKSYIQMIQKQKAEFLFPPLFFSFCSLKGSIHSNTWVFISHTLLKIISSRTRVTKTWSFHNNFLVVVYSKYWML